MKMISGSFGVSGSAYISRDSRLVIEGASKGIYAFEAIKSMSANVIKEKKFGIFGFIIGAIVLSIVLGVFFGIVGVVIALVVAIVGSFYSEKSNIVEITFSDQKIVALECTPRGVKKLIQFNQN